MKLTLLGTGTPWPCVQRQATANLLQLGSDNILFDAGRGVSTQLAKIGMHPRDIDFVFITHHHFDHIANLDDLLLAAWNDGRTETVQVFGPDGTASIIDHMFNGIYARDIAFRLKEAEYLDCDLPDIRDIVRAHDIAPDYCYHGDGWSVSCKQVEHGHAMGISHEDFPCLGYRVTAGDKVVAISGDGVDCEGVQALAKDADLLVQCCYLAEAEINNSDKRILCDHVLASAKQANLIARASQVKRMVLTHLAPKGEEMLEIVLAEAKANFDGEVYLGEDLMELSV